MPFHEVQPDTVRDRAPVPHQRDDREPRVVMLDDPETEAGETGHSLWPSLSVPRTLLVALLSAGIGAAGSYGLQHAASWSIPPDVLAVRLDTTALVTASTVTRGAPVLALTLTYRGSGTVRIAAVRYSSSDGSLAWWGNGQLLTPGRQTTLWGYLQLSCANDGSPGDGLWAEVFTSHGTDRLWRLRSAHTQSTFRTGLHRACG